MQNLIGKLAQRLVEKQLTLVLAESCTGGMLAQQCTSISGSSQWFECGFVTYSNASKIRLLGVQANVLNEHGAVSSHIAEQMAQGALTHSDADVSISITGIAGPDGATEDKPVGTVFIATAVKNQSVRSTRHQFMGDRTYIREQSTKTAIEQLITEMKNGQ